MIHNFKISLSESNTIKGLAILMIILHHFEQSCLSVDYLNVCKAFGPVGCSAFFFISGYGLTVSKSTKDLNYWLRRLLKIWIPFMLANIIYLIFNFYEITNCVDIVLYVLGIKLINGHCWFIHALLFLYIAYAISLKLSNIYIYILPVLFGALYSIITRSIGTISWMAFPLGILYAKKLSEAKFIIHTRALLYVSIPAFIISCYVYYHNAFLLNTIPLVLNVMVMVASAAFVFISVRWILIHSKVLAFIGAHSMDYYLIHGLCLSLLLPFSNCDHNLVLLCFIAITALCSTTFGFVSTFVLKIIKI